LANRPRRSILSAQFAFLRGKGVASFQSLGKAMSKFLAAASALAVLCAAGASQAADLVVFSTDFTTESTSSGVTAVRTGAGGVADIGASSTAFTGDVFRNDTGSANGSSCCGADDGLITEWTLSGLPDHDQLAVDFTLAFIDSWDGLNGTVSPDELYIYLDGQLAATLTSSQQTGSGSDVGGGTRLDSGGNLFFNASYGDTVYSMATASFLTFAHADPTFTLGIRAGGAGWQAGADESWGVDNLTVTARLVDNPGPGGVPEPGAWALMILGFGGAGAVMRRRAALAAA
jgi:hypothetical protein